MPFLPSDLDSLLCHYAADSIGVANGDPVSSWTDESANAADQSASGAARPTFRTSEINGLPAVQFDGTANRMTSSVDLPTDGVNISVAWVGKLVSKKNYNGIFALDTVVPAASYTKQSLWGDGTTSVYLYNSSGYVRTVTDLTTSGYRLSVYSSGSLRRFSTGNGQPVVGIGTSGTSTAPSGNLKLTLGHAPINATSYLNGYIAEIAMWDETELAESFWMEGYLAHKYGITLPTSHPFYAAAPTTPPGTGSGGGGFFNPFIGPFGGMKL